MEKICKKQFNTPKCLDQCFSCNQMGTNKFHYCYGCKNESYFKDYTIDKNANGFRGLHNCYPCNKACKSCYGDFIPKITTNCNKCFIEKGYCPFEENETICIGEDTQDYWEVIFEVVIYLDKPGDDKETCILKSNYYNINKNFTFYNHNIKKWKKDFLQLSKTKIIIDIQQIVID